MALVLLPQYSHDCPPDCAMLIIICVAAVACGLKKSIIHHETVVVVKPPTKDVVLAVLDGVTVAPEKRAC